MNQVIDKLKEVREGLDRIEELVVTESGDISEDNSIRLFLTNTVVRFEYGTVKTTVLWDRYKAWCAETLSYYYGKRAFNKTVENLGFIRGKSPEPITDPKSARKFRTIHVWKGMQLKEGG